MISIVRTSHRSLATSLLVMLALSACGGSGGGSSDGGAAATEPPVGGGGDAARDDDGDAGSGTGGSGDQAPGPVAEDDPDGASDASGDNRPSGGDDALRLVRIGTVAADGAESDRVLLWDEGGRLLAEREGASGALVLVRRYRWGERRRFEVREDDIGGDGTVERTADFTFGPDGRLSGERVIDADGATVETLSYSVGDDGLIESLVREDAERLLSRESYDHDAGGELQSVLIDSDGDGRADRLRGFDYDADGLVIGTTLRAFPDNALLARDVWTYERGACITDWMNSVQRPLCISFR